MKKLFLFAATAALFFACTPETNPADNTPSGDNPGADDKDKTVQVTGVSLDKTSAELTVGEGLTLIATVKPDNASDKSLIWSSDKEDVATVDQSGKVTAVKEGDATVTVKTKDGGKTAECKITVKAGIAVSETLDATDISATSAKLGGRINLEAPFPADLKVGVQYSKSADMPSSGTTTLEIKEISKSKTYEERVLDLEPSTVYYYRSFAITGGKEYYGNVMKMTSRKVEIMIGTLDVTNIAGYSVTLNGKLDKTINTYGQWYKDVGFSYGFYLEDTVYDEFYGTWEANRFWKDIYNLTEKTTYRYKAFVKIGDKTYYGEVREFTTGTAAKEITLDKEDSAVEVGGTTTITATVSPSDAAVKSVIWSSSDTDVATVDENGKVTAKSLGFAIITANSPEPFVHSATCLVYVCQIDGNLGLSVTWATSNLSETGLCAKPHDYGDYYAWGEIVSKDKPSWANYKWCNGSYNTLTKYNIKISYGNLPDGRKVLLTGLRGDDAASKILAGKWRMPTVEDYDELWEKCTWEWVEGFGESGVKGLLITGLNKNSIFLPAAGERWEKGLSGENTYGRYWSSNLDVSKPSYAQRLTFSFMETRTMDSIDRYYGFSIRPVKSN